MLKLDFSITEKRPFHLLCLGAHSDDIEIGCGGTILKLLSAHRNISVDWVVFSAEGRRRQEALASARRFLRGAQKATIAIKGFRGSFFPYDGGKIKKTFERLKEKASPDLILTHYRNDLHQDHRVICELTWNTFRDHLILEYEIPKFDGDLGVPNVYVGLTQEICAEKTRNLLGAFASQREKHWFTDDLFMSLLRLRGMEAGRGVRFAEAFYGRKLQLG
jgi:LmbE family N-acetylglucosaminyl deacetylase